MLAVLALPAIFPAANAVSASIINTQSLFEGFWKREKVVFFRKGSAAE